MRHDHLKRELELIILLTQNRMYSAEEICDMTGISRRSFYYYIEFFEQAGFKVEKRRGKYFHSRNITFCDATGRHSYHITHHTAMDTHFRNICSR